MKQILVLNTGGTLSSTQSASGLKPGLNGHFILDELQKVAQNYTLSYRELLSLDSANIGPAHWTALAQTISELHQTYDGIVIIHGTDTMAYTASMLSFMLQGIPVPVVVTGSQLSMAHPIADAFENCRAAIHMAASGCAGVFVAFNRKIMLGVRVSKTRTKSFDAFESINFPAIAQFDAYGMRIDRSLLPHYGAAFSPDARCCDRVFLLKLIPGLQANLLDLLCDAGYKGIVIEAFGLGGVPCLEQDFSAAIHRAQERGVVVVIGSQCRYDGTDLTVYETGKLALASGAIQLHDMTVEAAVTKLMWLLGHYSAPAQIQAAFTKNLVNEISI